MSFYSKPWHSHIIIVFVAVKEKIPVVDVDGSYVYQKHKSLPESGRSIVVVSTKIAIQFTVQLTFVRPNKEMGGNPAN